MSAAQIKKEERDARRRREHVPWPCRALWQSFGARQRWAVRRQLVDTTFTAFMRANLSPKRDATRKLRAMLQRYVHRCCLSQAGGSSEQVEPPPAPPAPGKQDDRAPGRVQFAFSDESVSTDEELEGIALHKAIEDPELQAAIAMSLEDTHRSASPSGRKTSARSLDEAGIPATLGSARAHRKKRSGR